MSSQSAALSDGASGLHRLWQRGKRRFGALYRYRMLIYNLVVRDLKSRYRNSVLGFVWSLLNPLGMMIVFTIVFSVLMPNNQIENYPIFLLCGLLPWNFFTASIMSGTNSIVANGNLVKKVFFPREVLPLATVLANLVNFLLALVVLFAVLLLFRMPWSPWLFLLPVVILIQTAFALGIVFLLSTMQVYYRDTLIVLDVVLLAWFFLTPVFYSTSILPATYTVAGVELPVSRLMYTLNPMASLINMYRDILYWGYRTDPDFFWRTSITAFGILAIGYWVFTRHSGDFGEEI
ncbi:MAG TPA: ABC transporter permease [Chloroflexi bacterium]|nr:ABC transporter permease [Chloroflexota bacterium]